MHWFDEDGALIMCCSPKRANVSEWISVEDRMPEERETMFAKFYGTDKWKKGMFRHKSPTVIVCIQFDDGGKLVTHAYTVDGKWKIPYVMKHYKITHWMPLPEAPEEG